MSSILTNYSAMTALQTLRNVNSNLGETQNRISTGLKVRSGKDNAAYFTISNTMRGDSGMYKSINEGLTMTKNSIATARAGAEALVGIATEFVERVAFAQGQAVDHGAIQQELDEIVGRMATVVQQSTFNGDNLVGTVDDNLTATFDDTSADIEVVTGITRAGANFTVTTQTFSKQNLAGVVEAFAAIDFVQADGVTPALIAGPVTTDYDVTDTDTSPTTYADALLQAEHHLSQAVGMATTFGVAEKSIDVQKDFLTKLVDEIDGGIGGMVDADMEQEAARMQALQVQQQLATQSLSIANQNPQNILALFR